MVLLTIPTPKQALAYRIQTTLATRHQRLHLELSRVLDLMERLNHSVPSDTSLYLPSLSGLLLTTSVPAY